MVSAGELVVSIIGDMANLKRVIREVQSDVKGMSQELNKVGKDMSSAGSAMSTGITAPMVAVAAGIGLTTNASINFDTELRKTTTMLPGITKDAFNQMGQQSLALSRQFGEDTKDINEAWYNALSSNVPENNVFEFMKTSSKLAIGGMTDVNTAVDGLTSAMNAYGPSILSAQQASDIMFVDCN
jgi:phage-related minor tail protein